MAPRCPRAIVCAAALLLGVQLAACGATEPPPRSPLGPEARTAISPSPAATPAAVATLPAAFSPVAGTPLAPRAAEAVVARALEQLAEWLALPARDLALAAADPVTWPGSCLGAARPGEACAQVATPGLRVVLRDALGGVHAVHADSGGERLRWAGEQRARGTIITVDTRAQRVTIDVEGRALVLRLVPGSSGPFDASALGRRAVAAYDPAPDGRPPALAWLALDPAP